MSTSDIIILPGDEKLEILRDPGADEADELAEFIEKKSRQLMRFKNQGGAMRTEDWAPLDSERGAAIAYDGHPQVLKKVPAEGRDHCALKAARLKAKDDGQADEHQRAYPEALPAIGPGRDTDKTSATAAAAAAAAAAG